MAAGILMLTHDQVRAGWQEWDNAGDVGRSVIMQEMKAMLAQLKPRKAKALVGALATVGAAFAIVSML